MYDPEVYYSEFEGGEWDVEIRWTRERVNHFNQIDSLNKENDCKWIVWTATDLKKIFNVEVRLARKVNFQVLHQNTVTEDSLE